jgi:heptosyltransferase-2
MINLDAGKISASLGAMAQAKKKFGYVLNPAGYVTGTNEAAVEWLKMGIFDDLKRANQRTYQDIMSSIIGLSPDGMKYILELTDEENGKGCSHLQELGLDLKKKIIGIHTGGGGRWIHKQWTEEGFIGLIPELYKEVGDDVQILLFGGPLERERNKRILSEVGCKVYDAGCDNEVRHFAALVNNCSVMISADSLAMHIALAMGCRVVVLFGPTSHAEIELFGFGEKVIPDKDCLVCYKLVCDCKPNCMESITIDMVKQAVHRQLSLS